MTNCSPGADVPSKERADLLPALLYALGVPEDRTPEAAEYVRHDVPHVPSGPRDACENLMGSLRVGGYVL